ncbi:MAG TPA: SRPBCC family protein [Acidimicrobiales bacterium]|nr:SRPBCC family protein [Acidimicrobiales bacterium]
MNTDSIASEVLIEAPIERVWAALTEPASVSAWFCNHKEISIDLRVGGAMVLDHGDHGRFQTVIVAIAPPNAFSFRWAALHPDVLATEENSTLVEFTLKTTPKGTVLRVLESGFDTLAVPAGRSLSSLFEDHSGGWPQVIDELAKYVMANVATPRVDSP